MKIITLTYFKIRRSQIRSLKALNTAWIAACQYDNIKPDSKQRITFSDDNPFAYSYEVIARRLHVFSYRFRGPHSAIIRSQIRLLKKLGVTWSWACQRDNIWHDPKHFAIFSNNNPFVESYERLALGLGVRIGYWPLPAIVNSWIFWAVVGETILMGGLWLICSLMDSVKSI